MSVRISSYIGTVDDTGRNGSYRPEIDRKGTKNNAKNVCSGDNDATEWEPRRSQRWKTSVPFAKADFRSLG